MAAHSLDPLAKLYVARKKLRGKHQQWVHRRLRSEAFVECACDGRQIAFFVEAVAGEKKRRARWLRREDLKLGHRQTLVTLIIECKKRVNKRGGMKQSSVHA